MTRLQGVPPALPPIHLVDTVYLTGLYNLFFLRQPPLFRQKKEDAIEGYNSKQKVGINVFYSCKLALSVNLFAELERTLRFSHLPTPAELLAHND